MISAPERPDFPLAHIFAIRYSDQDQVSREKCDKEKCDSDDRPQNSDIRLRGKRVIMGRWGDKEMRDREMGRRQGMGRWWIRLKISLTKNGRKLDLPDR